jgi:hypothetical protein
LGENLTQVVGVTAEGGPEGQSPYGNPLKADLGSTPTAASRSVAETSECAFIWGSVFSKRNGSIILVPEPATVSLLGFGAMFLKKSRKY